LSIKAAAVLTNNLMKVAETLLRRENKKKPRSRAASSSQFPRA